MDAFKAKDVWTVVVPPKDAHVLQDQDGCERDKERYKAGLDVCRNEQIFGVDYKITFAAVMILSLVKMIHIP